MTLAYPHLAQAVAEIVAEVRHTIVSAKGGRYSVTVYPMNGTGPAKKQCFKGRPEDVLRQLSRWREEYDAAAA